MKFLHAADIHLDSPMQGLRQRADLPMEVLDACTRRAFRAMIDLALAEDVAFVIIAGDLYDGDWKDFSTGLFFAEEMRRLGRPCFLLRGNHDAQSVISHKLHPPPNVRQFSARTSETFTLPELGVALHGHSFPNRAVPENLAAGYPPPAPGLLNIGVLHTSAEDPGEHETYAPCRISELVNAGYDYWALGHIHARRVLHEHPWIVFPGNLQGRHPRETGPKGCTLVTVEDRRIAEVEHRKVDVLRWATVTMDVEGADIARISEMISENMATVIGSADGRPTLLRLILDGRTDLHGHLLDDTDQIAAECRNASFPAGGELWVESVQVRTRPRQKSERDLFAPLYAAFRGGLDDPELIREYLSEMETLRLKLPAPARRRVLLPTDSGTLAALAEDAWAGLTDILGEQP
jgi:DNA repair protein SbcD/Mre11